MEKANLNYKIKMNHIFIFFSLCILIVVPIQASPLDETLTLHTINVDGNNQSYYFYLPPNPIGAVLIIPSYSADHTEFLDGDRWNNPDQSMENSPIIIAARESQIAVVFAEGVPADYYSPNNGEKKVLACLNDANNSLQMSSNSWFIYGFSMGGAGALTITIRHPNLFNGLYIGDGIWNFTDPSWISRYTIKWGSEELVKEVNFYRYIKVFENKAVFLASGINTQNLIFADNFSRALDENNIRHFYFRENDSHNIYLQFNSVNQTFKMFSHQITNTLDEFFEGYTSPLLTTSTVSAWEVNSTITCIFIIWILKKKRL